MSPENPRPTPEKPNPFGFTEREQLWDRVTHQRFVSILEDEQTNIHRAEVSSNTFGEFLFVTTSREESGQRLFVTFWGLGFHDYRERWITEEWFLNTDHTYPESLMENITLEEVKTLIHERQQSVEESTANETQTRRGQLYEMLADLTDDDGALAEFEDLEDFLDDFE
jgi:hypothetical protein